MRFVDTLALFESEGEGAFYLFVVEAEVVGGYPNQFRGRGEWYRRQDGDRTRGVSGVRALTGPWGQGSGRRPWRTSRQMLWLPKSLTKEMVCPSRSGVRPQARKSRSTAASGSDRAAQHAPVCRRPSMLRLMRPSSSRAPTRSVIELLASPSAPLSAVGVSASPNEIASRIRAPRCTAGVRGPSIPTADIPGRSG